MAEIFFDPFHILFFFYRKIGEGLSDPLIFPKDAEMGGQLAGYRLIVTIKNNDKMRNNVFLGGSAQDISKL
jgi:hypothetical protein